MNTTTMTSREIVSRAIHFGSPPRLPVTMGCFGVDDTGWVWTKPPASAGAGVLGTDEWGCAWERTELENMGQVKGHPLADIPSTLPTGDRRRVTEDVALLMDHWASPQGGFIFSDYGSDDAIGVKDAGIKRFMYDEFSRRSQTLYGAPLPPPGAQPA